MNYKGFDGRESWGRKDPWLLRIDFLGWGLGVLLLLIDTAASFYDMFYLFLDYDLLIKS